MPATAMLHTTDPRQALFDKIGDVSDIEVMHTQVLMAVYIAPEMTRGGIIRPDSNKEEDRHQSKVGLILKVGPQAFKSDSKWSWPGNMGVGDWVYLRRSDGWNITVNGSRENLCMMADDVDIRGRIKEPDQVW
jgi:co-chaperonin GroES (HSP10)